MSAYENPKILLNDKLKDLITYEKSLIQKENAIREKLSLKNDCEAFSYDYKRKITEELTL